MNNRTERLWKRSLVGCFAGLMGLLLMTRGMPDAAAQGMPSQGYGPAVWRAFNNAIYETAVYRRANVRRLLHPLRFDEETGTVRVTQLTDYEGYHLGPNPLGRDIYVTVVSEVRTKCLGVRGDLGLWLRMLLGLHPDGAIKHFVVMEARREDVFRPAADPDPTRPWPCADPAADRNCGDNLPADASPQHVDWMARNMLSQYVIIPSLLETRSTGYPWTRLGYTYNWRPGVDRYGACEYVVRKGGIVNVLDVIPYQQYCATGR